MAKSRAILKRCKAVENICKITRTMQLISTARFQKAFKRATAFKPYSEKITAMVGNISQRAEIDHPLLRQSEKPERIAVLVITSNRGLCGGYNSRVLSDALWFIREQRTRNVEVEVSAVGKKSIAYLGFLNETLAEKHVLDDTPTYADAERIASRYMKRFQQGELDAVYVAFMQFQSTSRQAPATLKLLPISPMAIDDASAGGGEYEFWPEPESMLATLLPDSVKSGLYQCFVDATVSEHVGRMVAMKSATDNAEDMIKALTRHANRARQSQITAELSELVSGAEDVS